MNHGKEYDEDGRVFLVQETWCGALQSGRFALGNGSSSSSLAAKSCLFEPLSLL